VAYLFGKYQKINLLAGGDIKIEEHGSQCVKKILVVDNDIFMLEFMADILSQEGYEIIKAEDGLSALDILKTETPDTIFVDLVMPNIDGRKLCKIIRGMERFKHSQIIILSALAAEEDIDIAQLGANACIAKGPFDEMTQEIMALLDRSDPDFSQHLSEERLSTENAPPRGITEELLAVKRHFEIILEKMAEAIIEVNADGRIIYANSTTFILTNKPEAELLGSHFLNLFEKKYHQRITELLSAKGDETRAITADSPVTLNGQDVTLNILSVGDSESSVIILNDITQRKRTEAALRESEKRYKELSMTDDLTGIYNSRFFHRQLRFEVERAKRYKHPLSLLIFDVDDFKLFNDTYGHIEGDKVLATLGRILRESIRDSDSACRYGGEEFTLILPVTNGEGAIAVGERIRAQFESHDFIPKPGQTTYSTVSVGVAQYRAGETIDALTKRADKALYEAKANGKNQIWLSPHAKS
jgi:diguanylate cyclase (GGDEF)-like protein/PAS domain S-box-containing protein